MNCKILHENRGRMRVHIAVRHMSSFEADKIQYYLSSLPFVKKADVNERTSNAIVFYDSSYRTDLIQAFSEYCESTEITVPEHTGRELRIEYEDRMFFHIAGKLVRRFIIPLQIRRISCLCRNSN